MGRLAFVFVVVVATVNDALAVTGVEKSVIQAQFVTRGLSCIQNNPLTLGDINTLRMLKMPRGAGAKCFVACLFKSIGVLDNMGAVSAMSARQSAKQVFANDETTLDKVESLVKECEKVNAETVEDGDKGCDRAARAFTCLTENGPKYGLDLKF